MTIKEIARIAGVSTSTVSKIFNGNDAQISPTTREHVLQIVNEYNYKPYSKIKSKASGTSFIVAILSDIQNTSPTFLRSLSMRLARSGYHLLLCDNKSSPNTELKQLSYLATHDYDALIWNPLNQDSLPHANEFLQTGTKHLTFGPCNIDSLHLDFADLAYQATAYLIYNKHKKIAFLYDAENPSLHHTELVNGFSQCLVENSLFFHDDLIHAVHSGDILHFLKTHDITAVFTDSKSTGKTVYKELLSKGYSIPFYLSILSATWTDADDFLSTIMSPEQEFGEYMADSIVNLLKTGSMPEKPFSAKYHINNETITEPHTFRDAKIVVLGSINIDTFFNIQHFPSPEISSHTTSCSIAPGGKGLNVAIGVSRFQHNVSLIGKIGSEEEADIIYEVLNENHVDTSFISRDETYSTAKAFIYLQPDGTSARSILDGANMGLSATYIDNINGVFESCRYLIVTTDVPLDAVNRALDLAKSHQCMTIVKPVHLSNLSMLQIDKIDLLVLNTEEATKLSNGLLSPYEQFRFFSKFGIRQIVITSWTDGCYLLMADYRKFFPPNHFELLDGTGGSDAFISALASYLMYGYSLEKAAEIANYAASFCTSRMGIVPALIDRTSLELYINRVNPDLLIK